MPCFNAAATLAAALESILAQTLDDFEVVAVDDGSTDATAEVLRTFAARDTRIRPIFAPHGGIVAALNAGLGVCRGELVARMDADDLCLPERLARQARMFTADPLLGVASCRVRFGGCENACAGYAAYVEWINGLLGHEEMALARFVESPLAHPSAMLRRDVLARHGGYAAGRFPEDYELWLRLFAAGVRFAKHPDELLVWNDPPNRLSRTHENYGVDAFYALKSEHLAAWLRANAASWPEVVVWGAGRVSRKRAELLTGLGARVSAYVDIDPRKIGQRPGGVRVIAPDMLPAPGAGPFLLTYVASRGARGEITAHLAARGYLEGAHYLHAA